jgi:hypothetical protein
MMMMIMTIYVIQNDVNIISSSELQTESLHSYCVDVYYRQSLNAISLYNLLLKHVLHANFVAHNIKLPPECTGVCITHHRTTLHVIGPESFINYLRLLEGKQTFVVLRAIILLVHSQNVP